MLDYSGLTAAELQNALAAYMASAASGFTGGAENIAALRAEIDKRSRNQKLLIAAAMVAVFFFVK